MTATPYPITAYSLANGLGRDTETVLARLVEGRHGLVEPPLDLSFETLCGAVPQPYPQPPDALRHLDSRNNRIAQLALEPLGAAIAHAIEAYGSESVGIVVGSTTAALLEAEAAFAHHRETGALPAGFDFQKQTSQEGLLRFLVGLTGIRGPGTVVSTACSSSAKAFAIGRRWLDAGVVDAVLVGGVDSLCQMTLRGFHSLQLVSPESPRPFGAERRGINIGEGAAFALLERSGAGPLLLGCGESSDAYHMSAPDPEGRGARSAMSAALEDASVDPSALDLVNAHGTGTQQNDRMEARAIRDLLGEASSTRVVSTKGYTGHLLGAAGATEAVFVIASLERGFIPASLGSSPVDPEIAERLPHIPDRLVRCPVRRALSNSFAFGGNNVSLLFGAPA